MLKRYILAFLVVACAVSSCERDDICAVTTPTTPQLVIAFYDVSNSIESKAVSLKVWEISPDNSVEPSADTLSFANDTLIRVPLRTDSQRTTLVFEKNPDNSTAEEDPENRDIITFNYTINEVFIDRACGFKVNYSGLSAQGAPGTDGRWIDNLDIINNGNIIDEDTTHIIIRH